MNAIVRLPHPRSGDSRGQETFLAPSADKQNPQLSYKVLKPPSLSINSKAKYILYNYIIYYINIYINTYIHIYFIYIQIHIVCSTLKHQLNTGILDENDTCISNAVSVSSRKCSI